MAENRPPVIRTGGLVRIESLREALRFLREAGREGLGRAELAHRLGGTSLRTVDRAMRLLREQGATFSRGPAAPGGYQRFVLEKGPDWDEHVTPEARLALRLAALSLSQATASFFGDKLQTIEKLVNEHMSSRDQRLFETLQKAVQIHGGVDDSADLEDVLEPILRALEKGRELEVRYRAAGREVAEAKTVVPHCLTLDIFSGGSFLAAWDPTDGKPKHLRLCRIEEARVGACRGVIADPSAMAHAAKYQIGGWTCGDPPFEVRVRIHGTHWVRHFREAPPALPAIETTEAPDHVEVRFLANHLNGASRWILQFGALAEVLAPPELRDHVLGQHLAAAALYLPEHPDRSAEVQACAGPMSGLEA